MVLMFPAVFLPEQFQGQVLVILKFLMDGDEIRWRVNTPAGRRRPVAEHQFIQLVLAEIFRQRPSELRRLCQFQVFVNGALDDRATAGDLVLRQPQCRQPQDLADLAHRQSFFRQI